MHFSRIFQKTSLSVGAVLVFFVVLIVLLLFWTTRRAAPPSNAPVLQMPSGMYIAYATQSLTELGQYTVVLENLLTGKRTSLAQFSTDKKIGSPIFSRFDAEHVLIERAGEEARNILLDVRDGTQQTVAPPIPSNVLFSPSGRWRAELQYPNLNDGGKPLVTVYNALNESKLLVPNPSDLSAAQYLRPRSWSKDEKELLLDYVHDTEGFLVGLARYNRETSVLDRVPNIDQLQLSQLVFDDQEYVYGVDVSSIEPFGTHRATDIIRVNLKDGHTTTFTLRQSTLSRLWSINPSGRFLAYGHDAKEGTQDLWVLDMVTGKETGVTTNAVVSRQPMWLRDQLLVYVDNAVKSESSTAPVLQRYNATTGEKVTVAPLPSDRFSISDAIGWFVW